MAFRTGDPQGFAAQAVQSHFARGIAQAVYRADRRDDNASLSELTCTEQAAYDRVGIFVLRLSEESQLRAGLYAGADALVQGGIGSLPLPARAKLVGLFTRAFMAMKRQMNGTAPQDDADLMRALVEADRHAGINAQPVHTTPASDKAIDLAALETATEVH